MTTSIYSMPIESTIGIARHYFISNDGTFENSIGWGSKGIEYKGKGVELILEQEQRIREYPAKFGKYNIHINNCEMFAWYVITGKRYSGQTQKKLHTTIGAIAISLVQPVLTVRSMDTYKLEQAIAKKLNDDLDAARKAKLELEQAERDEFWRKRHAGFD
jgi:hypothetical protein